MGGFLQLSDRLEVAPGVRVLKRADYARLLEAQQLLAQAKAEAERIVADAGAAYEKEKQRGYEDGLLEGKAEMAERMLEGLSRGVEYLQEMESSVVDVVMKALVAVLGEMEDQELVCRIVRKALQQVRDQKRIVLRVSVEDAETVRARLDEMVRSYPGIGIVDLTPDPRLTAKQCILETEMGVVDASLNKQLEIIEKSFRHHLSGARE